MICAVHFGLASPENGLVLCANDGVGVWGEGEGGARWKDLSITVIFKL